MQSIFFYQWSSLLLSELALEFGCVLELWEQCDIVPRYIDLAAVQHSLNQFKTRLFYPT